MFFNGISIINFLNYVKFNIYLNDISYIIYKNVLFMAVENNDLEIVKHLLARNDLDVNFISI